MKYLIPCPACGTRAPVEFGQAGQTVVCSCGHSIEVPSIRKLRQYESVAEEKATESTWTKRKGVAFLGSAILAIAALVAAVLFFLRPTVDFENVPKVETNAKLIQQEIDSLSSDEGLIRFVLMQPWPPTPFAQRLEKGEVPVYLLASAELISRFEGPGQQFLASKQALEIAQKVAARNADLLEKQRTRKRINDWLSIVAALGGVGFIVAGSALFIGNGQLHDPARGKPTPRSSKQSTAGRR